MGKKRNDATALAQQEPAGPPSAVLSIADLATRDVAVEVWRAAHTVFECVDEFNAWLIELDHSGDANPAAVGRIRANCSSAIFAMCFHGAFTPIFRNTCPDEIVGKLPSVPFRRGWQTEAANLKSFTESLEFLGTLQGECSAILSQLATAPLAAFGWGTEQVSGGSKPTPSTLVVIRLIERGKSTDEIVTETKQSAANVRKIRSRLTNGEYVL